METRKTIEASAFETMIERLKSRPEVEAIALGGSRASGQSDSHSDYDVYLYLRQPLSADIRKTLLEDLCLVLEIGNRFWEEEDNLIFTDGVYADLIYRSLSDFENGLVHTIENANPSNGYTTCMWYNLMHSKCLYDPQGRYSRLQSRFDRSYPETLRAAVIERASELLFYRLPNYRDQIFKAAERHDSISLLHRSAAFFESYFDLLFAVNRLAHPGEKRLVEWAKTNCSILPERFEDNITDYLQTLFTDPSKAMRLLDEMIDLMQKLLENPVGHGTLD